MAPLGTVNKYLDSHSKSVTPHNTTMLVYNPLIESPEGCDVLAYMLDPMIQPAESDTFWDRLLRSLSKPFKKQKTQAQSLPPTSGK